jgi:hypothetical protein
MELKSGSLTPNSKYDKLLHTFTENKNKIWSDWLDFDKNFDKPGKQGLVGLLKLKEDEDFKYVFKISQYINYLVEHESIVMGGLNDLSFCPHFCKFIGNINCEVDPESRKTGNPFNKEAKYSIEKSVLLCEYIDKSYKFCNYIKAKDKISENILYSVVKQVLLAISIAQTKKNFCHYDLHSNNIMIKKCNKDVVFLYVLDEENQFCVPTFGYYPIIIDFGFSYIKDMDDNPLWPSLGHTNIGFMSDRFDWVADPKLFLVTVSDEIKEIRGSNKSKKFRKMVKNIFSALDIDFKSGWDKNNDKSVSDQVLKILRRESDKSYLFKDYDHYCIDILQSLIILPLEKQDYDDIKISFSTFLKEWKKIENKISSHFYNLYILKSMVDVARVVHPYYLDKETREYAVKEFKIGLLEIINKVSNFCNIKDIHYEKMLCALLTFSKSLEGIFYDIMNQEMNEKEKKYNKLPVSSIEQIYGSVELNIKDEYVYNENTNVFIINSHKGTYDLYKIPEKFLENVNKLHPISRGTYIYDLYKL